MHVHSLLEMLLSILLEQTGLRVLAWHPFGYPKIIVYYYRSLVYFDFQGQPRRWKAYGESIMVVKVKR